MFLNKRKARENCSKLVIVIGGFFFFNEQKKGKKKWIEIL